MSKADVPGKTVITKDFKTRTVVVSRELEAPLADVWRAYTEAALLDQWWGPAPWRAETRHMDFRPGGHWLYAMVSPEGQRHWGRMNYIAIEHHSHFDIVDSFCDENGNVNPQLPVSQGSMIFTATENGTLVEFRMTYASEEAIRAIVEMGFEAGITACLDQLAALLEKGASAS